MITQPVIFDYKVNPNDGGAEKERNKDEDERGCEAGDDRVELKNTLLQKLEMLCDKMRAMEGEDDGAAHHISLNAEVAATCANSGDVMEDVLVGLVDRLTQKSWKADEVGGNDGDDLRIPEFMTQKYRGMTILHLAASLGYSRLTSSLLHWSADNPTLTLQTEIDALAQDSEGFTPLVSERVAPSVDVPCSLTNIPPSPSSF